MEKIPVYYFRGFDIVSSKLHTSKQMATIERINRLKTCEPLLETKIEIDSSELDGNEFYWPNKRDGKNSAAK